MAILLWRLNLSNFVTDMNEYPDLLPLEENWQKFKDAYEKIKQKTMDWHEPIYSGKWGVFGFIFMGQKMNEAECPEIHEILDKIPNVTTAGFSVLGPKSFILPHTGYTDTVLRCHMGIICPEGASITVGGEKYIWKEGEAMVFDDTLQHSASNEAGTERVVFLLDFKK